jgi:hypothetical protein
MKCHTAAIVFLLTIPATSAPVRQAAPERPKAGETAILPSSEIKPGMKGVAWTVFKGAEPEPVPVEIIGLWRNAWGPRQDIILAKMGGQAQRTNVAGGMSGSPVYIDGKLIGAVSLRLSVFSPDAICGITPIELMLEISEFDTTRPAGARTPDQTVARVQLPVPGELLPHVAAAGGSPGALHRPILAPIETPLSFSGFHGAVLHEFGPLFEQLGLTAVQGGAAGSLGDPKPGPGWESSLQPGDPIAGVLVSGDMTISGLGTVTYNDGKRVVAFGHPFFNLGPIEMPMGRAEVLTVLSSSYQPSKVANATEIVGALRQDRHSGIMGVLGETAAMIPVSVKVRSLADDNSLLKERAFRYNVFVQQRWTPTLMMLTVFNCISGVNDFAIETTYRLNGTVELDGGPDVRLSTMQAPGELPVPAPMLLAGWLGDRFSRLFLNAVKAPRLKRVDVSVDLLPQRRVASIENAWTEGSEFAPGAQVPVRVFLRPYRGERLEREFKVNLPAGLPKGEHRILLSDAETLNRMQGAAGRSNRFIDLERTVSLLNQERSNNRLYVSLVRANPTAYYDDLTLPSLPASVLNVMQTGRSSNWPLITSRETVFEQAVIPFDFVVDGSYSLRITVK